MNLHELLQEREAAGRPIRVGLIGSGRFGTMYLSQARNIPGVRVAAIADINTARARESLARVGWPEDAIVDSVDALSEGRTAVIADAMDLFRTDIDVIVEATGNPIVGIKHALAAIDSGKHVMMVTVEADALAGPALAARAKAAGVVYSMAFGDQPALIWEPHRLGPHLRLRRRLRGQGRQVPARLPPDEPRQRLGPLGVLGRAEAVGAAEPQHAHVLPRRHEGRDRDGCGRERRGPRARRRGPHVHARQP
ncbi:Gfo/Idh/MocA family oxidoreductase [Agrococcus sp. SL85]|nr:Gfo/Idh/MocA family oxidoreductase [Agrococcus sp. SL85]